MINAYLLNICIFDTWILLFLQKQLLFNLLNPPLLLFPQHAEWNGCTHAQMRMMDAIMTLDQLVDESDPDVDFPNSFHAFQTAEGIRQAHPDKGNHGERLNWLNPDAPVSYQNDMCSLHRLVPVGGPHSRCWENNGHLEWATGRMEPIMASGHRRSQHHVPELYRTLHFYFH